MNDKQKLQKHLDKFIRRMEIDEHLFHGDPEIIANEIEDLVSGGMGH